MLSNAVAERPFAANVAQEQTSGQDNGLSVFTKDKNFGDSEAMEAILVNANQFYRWLTDLESAMRLEVNSAIQQELPVVIAKMKLYLQNPSTRAILFKPIKKNIVEARIQLQSLLKAEYSPKEINIIDMVDVLQLEAQLDNLL